MCFFYSSVFPVILPSLYTTSLSIYCMSYFLSWALVPCRVGCFRKGPCITLRENHRSFISSLPSVPSFTSFLHFLPPLSSIPSFHFFTTFLPSLGSFTSVLHFRPPLLSFHSFTSFSSFHQFLPSFFLPVLPTFGPTLLPFSSSSILSS